MISETAERKALAQKLQVRDPEVLDRLIDQYQYRLFRYLSYLTESREVAEDLFQETWIRVLEHGQHYDGRSRFDTWLFAIARHLVIDRFRTRKNLVSFDAWMDSDEPWPGGGVPASGAPSPYDLMSQREVRDHLGTLLDRLPASSREVLVLRFQEEFSLEEIAKLVAAPVSTVKSRLYRGMTLLRELLEGSQHE